MEDFDAGAHVGPPDEPQDPADYHDQGSLEFDHLDAFGSSRGSSGKVLFDDNDRPDRHGERHNAATATNKAATGRRKPGSPKTVPPRRQSTSLALRALTQQPGGRFDSFNTLPSGVDGGDLVAKLVLHAHHQVYSNFFVGEASETSVLPYTKHALHHEHAYWGAAWFSATSRRWLAGGSLQHTPQEMFFYSKSLESLRRALDDFTLATHESTISTILHLSFPPYLPIVDRSIPCPRQSNFKTWNLLHLATGLNVAEEHMIGLATIIRLLGGVQNIKSAQIRRSVCFQGIHFSGRHLKAPLFPFASLHPIEHLVQGTRLLRFQHGLEYTQSSTPQTRGTGFHDIMFPETPPGSPQPAVVWQYLADMTSISDDYASGGSIMSYASLILDQMQLTQHSLLSLPPAADLKIQYDRNDEEKETQSDAQADNVSPPDTSRQPLELQLQIYEITRLAAICYANYVTYPTDYSTFPRMRLANRLLVQLEKLYDTTDITAQLSTQEIRLVFWATVLGAIMTVGHEAERAVFVTLVGRAAADAGVSSWIEAKDVMESFLWHAHTSDADALKLWIEVQNAVGKRSMRRQPTLPDRGAGPRLAQD